MRFTYILLTILLVAAKSLIAQPPPPPILFPLPTDKALWAENTGTKYALEGDTIINSNNYKKIWTSTDAVFNLGSSTYFAALREEPAGVVKVIMAGATAEETLYNFNLLAGIQSADIYLHTYGHVNVMIVGYDSIQVETETRPVYKVRTDQGFEYDWIGGIGSMRGLFNPAANFDPIEELHCFHQNDTLVYLHENITDCNTTAVSEPEAEQSIKVYPNPAKTHLRIVMDFISDNASLVITDTRGSVVSNYQLGSGNAFTVFDMHYAPGLYFYHLSDKGVIKQSGKLIFQ